MRSNSAIPTLFKSGFGAARIARLNDGVAQNLAQKTNRGSRNTKRQPDFRPIFSGRDIQLLLSPKDIPLAGDRARLIHISLKNLTDDPFT